MKKFLLLILFAAPSFGYAQFTKGQVFLGGSLSTQLQSSNRPVTPTTNNYAKNNSLAISPNIGYFLNSNIAIGANLSYATSIFEVDYQNNTGSGYVNAFQKNSANSYGLGSFVRYYLPISNSFYFALHGQISFNRSTAKTVYNDGTNETTSENPYYSIGATIKPVFIFFPSTKWGIEASVGSLGYSYQRNLPNVYSTNSFGLNAGPFGLGLAYYFAKK